jgi:hypothetical protein
MLATLAGCAATGGSELDGVSLNVTGDDKGGKIPGGVGGANTRVAMGLVTAHCAKFGKKGVITQMDFDTGLMAFQCLQQKNKSGS